MLKNEKLEFKNLGFISDLVQHRQQTYLPTSSIALMTPPAKLNGVGGVWKHVSNFYDIKTG